MSYEAGQAIALTASQGQLVAVQVVPLVLLVVLVLVVLFSLLSLLSHGLRSHANRITLSHPVQPQAMHPVVAAWRGAVFSAAEAERGRLEAGRVVLDPGLALARDGELAQLRELHRAGWVRGSGGSSGSSSISVHASHRSVPRCIRLSVAVAGHWSIGCPLHSYPARSTDTGLVRCTGQRAAGTLRSAGGWLRSVGWRRG